MGLQPLYDPLKRLWDYIVIPPSYVIFKRGNVILAKNGETGGIEFRGTDYDTIKNNVINALPNKTGLVVDKTREIIKYEWYFQGKRRNFDLLPYVNRAPKRASVILIFDDNLKTHYSVAFPLLKQKGYRGVIAINPDTVLGTITLEQLEEMRDYGWEIANHMWTHTRTDTLTRVQVELQVEKGKRWIENNLQSPCLVFVYPGGVTTDVDGKSITDIVASYHPYARTTTGGLWDYTPDPEILCRLARNDQVANFDAWLDAAIAQEKGLILVIHKVDSADADITEDNLRSLLDKIEAKGLEVVTFRDVAGRYTFPFARWKGMPSVA